MYIHAQVIPVVHSGYNCIRLEVQRVAAYYHAVHRCAVYPVSLYIIKAGKFCLMYPEWRRKIYRMAGTAALMIRSDDHHLMLL